MIDLTTSYLGFTLPHPLIVGASPFADSLDSARRIEDAGAAALIMRSIFQEQIDTEAMATHMSTDTHAESFGEALSFFPSPSDFVVGPDEYLERLRRTKEALGIPVFASLNGSTLGGWLAYATALQEAGADALELNVYYVATDAAEAGSTIEDAVVNMVSEVKQATTLPVAIKLSPFYTSLAHFARRLANAGADAFVLFNRYYEPDIDTHELDVVSRLRLSDPTELALRLRWLAVLSAQCSQSLAVTGGVHDAPGAIKAIMCGAHAVQLVSVLLLHGPHRLGQMLEGLRDFMAEAEYMSMEQMRGSMNLDRCPDPEAYRRANYMRVLQTWSEPGA